MMNEFENTEILGESAIKEAEETVNVSEYEYENIGDATEYPAEIGTNEPVQYVVECAHSEEILNNLVSLNELVYEAVEMQQVQQQNIWEKPLEKYNTQESIQTTLLIVIVGVIIFKMIGGIVTCKM